MSTWIENFVANNGAEAVPAEAAKVKTEEEQVEGVVEQEQTVEEIVETPVNETPPEVVPEQTQEEKKEAAKKKLDLSGWIQENKEYVNKYINEKDIDYNTYSDVEAIKLKVKKEYPTFTDEDINLLLNDKYAVGLEKIVIDKDNMTDEEIKEAKEHNKKIDLALLALKADAKKAKDYLNETKGEFNLPEFEIESEDPETIVKSYIEQETKKVEEYVNNTWKPTLEKGLEQVSSLNIVDEIEDNGGKVALTLDYKLTDKDKQKLVNDLLYRQQQESDKDKYIKPDGSIDFQKFFNDEGERILYKEISRAKIKQAMAEARKSVVKNELVNFDPGIKQTPVQVEEKSFSEKVLGAFKRN